MAEILWVNPVGTGAFDDETLALIDAVRSSSAHAARAPPRRRARRISSTTCTSTQAFGPMLELMRDARGRRLRCRDHRLLLRRRPARAARGAADAGRRYGRGEPACSPARSATASRSSSVAASGFPKMSDNVVLLRPRAEARVVPLGRDGDPGRAGGAGALLRPRDRGGPAGGRGRRRRGDRALRDRLAGVLGAGAPRSCRFLSSIPGVACWKWAELVADLYQRLGLTHSKVFGFESPPLEPPRA